MKKFYFLSGLPRSGSTVLSAILAQHPEVYVSVTSPLSDLLFSVEQRWHQLDQHFTMPFPHHLESLSYFMIHGFYESVDQNCIFDKSRAWPRLIRPLAQVFEEAPKIICTVRDIPSILASFHRLFQWKGQEANWIETELFHRGLPNLPRHRAQILWEKMVKPSWESLKDGFQMFPQSLLLVEYEDLLKNPDQELQRICDFCALPPHKFNYQKIEKRVEEIDAKWGINGLHEIGSTHERRTRPPEEILDPETTKIFADLRLEFWRDSASQACAREEISLA